MINLEIFFSNIKGFFLKRYLPKKKLKTFDKWARNGYIQNPQISFIIQSHNKSSEVKYIVSKLRRYKDAEIIVIDDGSKKKHTKSLAAYLTRGNEFLLKANDLYEVITYDRAIRLANGAIVALLQDDDDFNNLEWIDKALGYFKKYPSLVILGGRDGIQSLTFDYEKRIKDISSCQRKIITGETFRFVQLVNRAPMLINRQLFLDYLKHIDFDYAPFQYDDCEICLRAWLNNLQVGWYPANFVSLSQGGMRIWNRGLAGEQVGKNLKKLYDTYETALPEIDALVDKANLKLNT